MKRAFLLPILLVAALAANAYTPIVREGVRWVYLACDVKHTSTYNPVTDEYESGYVGNGDFAYFMEFRGDTTFNRLSYKKLYASLTRDFDEKALCPVAFMRQEYKHVYVVPHPEGQFQYVDQRNLELSPDGMVFNTNDWEEFELYDFSDMPSFLGKVMPWLFNGNYKVNTHTVQVGSEECVSFSVDEYGNDPEAGPYGTLFTVTEGVGNEQGFLLHLGAISFPRCICPVKYGLAQVEDLKGNVLYYGPWHYKPYQPTGKEDVSNVNHIIDVVLGIKPFSRHYFHDDYCDTNADYIVDVTDVNNMIDIILGKNQTGNEEK